MAVISRAVVHIEVKLGVEGEVEFTCGVCVWCYVPRREKGGIDEHQWWRCVKQSLCMRG